MRRSCKSEDAGENPVAGSIAHVAQEERQHVESVSSAGANPAVGTNLNPGISLKGERLSYKEEAAERYRHPRPVY